MISHATYGVFDEEAMKRAYESSAGGASDKRPRLAPNALPHNGTSPIPTYAPTDYSMLGSRSPSAQPGQLPMPMVNHQMFASAPSPVPRNHFAPFAPADSFQSNHVNGGPNEAANPWLQNLAMMSAMTFGGTMGTAYAAPFGMSHMSPIMGGGAMPVLQTGRTVYVGNLPGEASVDELLNLVRFGPIESVKILPEKSCAFISFLDSNLASAFHADILMRKVQLHGQDLKIGWGKPSPVPNTVMTAVQQNGATRNVYLGNLDEHVTEQALRDDLSRFGPIDQVKIVRDQGIGFVHFLSIATAMKVVATLPSEPGWETKRVNYGKDRCAYVPKNQHQQQQHNLAAAALAASFTGSLNNPFVPASNINQMGMMDPNAGNRTVYLGNLHPDTNVEEICNAIRGGILQQIRYLADKHICFVTFVDPNAALAFLATSVANGITIHNRRLKVGWGKHPGPPPPAIALVVQAGGSRNIYIGNLEDFDSFNEHRLREDFAEYGEIELVNLLREKNCAFVNFTQINYAIKALEGIKSHPDYQTFKIAYGKDRCGNAPRGGFGLTGAGLPQANGVSMGNKNNQNRSAEQVDETIEVPLTQD